MELNKPYDPFDIFGMGYLSMTYDPYAAYRSAGCNTNTVASAPMTPEMLRRSDMVSVQWRLESVARNLSYAFDAAEQPWTKREISEILRTIRNAQEECRTAIEYCKGEVDKIDRDILIKEMVAKELAKSAAPDQTTSKS